MATRMQQRRGTAAEWTSVNPILASGEIGFETDTNQFRIGDGVTNWADLSYFETLDDIQTYVDNAVAGVIDSAPETLNTLNEIAAALNDDANAFTTLSNQITSGDSSTLSSAQSYADNQDTALYSQITSDFQAYTDSETSDKASFDYVDAGDSATLVGANAYTDVEIVKQQTNFNNHFMLMGA